jgi:hypothetical protein
MRELAPVAGSPRLGREVEAQHSPRSLRFRNSADRKLRIFMIVSMTYCLEPWMAISRSRSICAVTFLLRSNNECGYDDLCFLGCFELGGFHAKEIEAQMQIFAEELMPVLARECGGKVELPARRLDLVVERAWRWERSRR